MRNPFIREFDPTRRALKSVGADMSLYAINTSLGRSLAEEHEARVVLDELRAGRIAAADFVTKTVITVSPVEETPVTMEFTHVRLITETTDEVEVS